MDEAKTLAWVADDLGIPANTIKTWLHQLDFIPAIKDSAGRWKFDDEGTAVLREIKALRLDGRTLNTVRRRFNDRRTTDEPEAYCVPEVSIADSQELLQETDERRSTIDERPTNVTVYPAQLDTAAIVEAVTAGLVPQLAATVAMNNELAEKYARAAHTIGTLEATVKAKDERLELLTSELTAARTERDQARALQAAPARPWWKLWAK